MASNNIDNKNELKDLLYKIGSQEVPEFIWHWFFRYFSSGSETFFNEEPQNMLTNYKALISMGLELLRHKYNSGAYSKFIKDATSPDSTYYFVGDTHGSFSDTFTMINYFVKVFQANPNVKIVWIGDIVDRNPYDLQNLAFILSFWITFQDNVFLIRGNHEDGSVCSRYGFSQHIYEKSGNRQIFNELWELILNFFSKLPLGMYCRVGNKNVLAVHGGIPFDIDNYKPMKLAELEPNLNCFIPEHFDMDKFSQTILWSDPDPFMDEPVAPSPHTGRPRFNKQAFDDFMSLNSLDLLIRGHQKWKTGYNLFFENRLVSLFSTSTYDSRHIGDAKFLRLTPNTKITDIGDEYQGQGLGILRVDDVFLKGQIEKYYSATQK